jgi:DSF synthase
MTFFNRIPSHTPATRQATPPWADPAQTSNGESDRHDAAMIAAQRFENLNLHLAPEDSALWCMMEPRERPSFTVSLLADLARMQTMVSDMFASGAQHGTRPFDYFVFGSNAPGVFNLGGDLLLFRQKIEAQDAAALRAYAYRCVDTVYANYSGYENRVITIALVEGDALGGGFEAALSCDLIVAERQAKFGLPEILFNLFPGMGAYSYLSRRIGAAKAEEMIMSGNLYSAEEMQRLGVVDIVVDSGEGRDAVRRYIADHRSKQNAQSAIYQARRRVNVVTLAELRDVTDIWIEAALRLAEPDLRKMTRLAAAQDKSRQRRLAALAIAAE